MTFSTNWATRLNLHFGRKPSESNSGYRLSLDELKKAMLIIEPGCEILLPHEDNNKTRMSLRPTKFLTYDQLTQVYGHLMYAKDALTFTRTMVTSELKENENL